jgi:hypothetical protein
VSRKIRGYGFGNWNEKGEADPKEWPWSSWSFYAKGEPGLIRIDVEG